MSDVAYAFTIYFVTLGPLKTVPAFFLATHGADRSTAVALARRSAIVATVVVLFVALVASGTMVKWRVSPDAMAIAGGLLLLIGSAQTLTGFRLAEVPAAGPGEPARIDTSWLGRPVLSPLTIPAIVTPIGIVAILFFTGMALGDATLPVMLVGVLLLSMLLNWMAMLGATSIMRAVGLPVLQVIGWIFSALQAGLGVEAIIGAVRHLVLATVLVGAIALPARAQELEPRAYAIAPVGTTIVLASVGGSRGGILFDPSVDVADVRADLKIVTPGFGYTFALAGRQARVLGLFPIAWGNIAGDVGAQPQRQDLRGLADPRIRFSIGLRGASARSAAEIARAPKRVAMGLAVTVMPPWGQYDRERLVNLGYNRWAFKPELGATRTYGRWTLDGAAGVWLFTANSAYSPGQRRKTQDALASFQGHLSYTFPRRVWIALHGAWFAGGQTRVDDVESPDEQHNTRAGATLSLPLGKTQSVKLVYNTGTTTRRGTDFNSFSAVWQLVKF